MKIDNPVVDEVREARRQILASYDWDYQAMVRDMMKKQWESGHEVIPPAPIQTSQTNSLDCHSGTCHDES